MLVAPEPSWRELLGMVKLEELNDILTSGSAMSIKLILDGYCRIEKKASIKMLLPDYFCAETESIFKENNINIIRYPLNDTLEPDWKIIKNKYNCLDVDFFVFVHYFGCEHDVSRARTFCDTNDILLIEDCAHVLYPYGKIGKKGHFSVFSPHKFLPIPDGGIVRVNSDIEVVLKIGSYIKEKCEQSNNNRFILWRVKKSALKILHISKNVKFELGPHFLDMRKKVNLDFSISGYSKKVLSNYTYEKMKEIAYKRRENLQIINEVLLKLDKNIRIMVDENIECPLFGVYSLENIKEPLEYVERIKKLGLIVSFWPSVHDGIHPLTDEFNRLTKYIITIPIHQSLSLNKLAKLVANTSECSNMEKLEIELISDTNDNKEIWDDILSKSRISNITQDWTYGEIKRKAEKWTVNRYLIKAGSINVGVVQALIKKICGIPVACRINKGPIFVEEYASIDNELQVVEILRKMYVARPFLYVPYEPYCVKNLGKMIQSGWKLWDEFGFPTGKLDLSLSEEEIRAGLDSKWRNQLKTAEKKGYTIRSDFEFYTQMLELYQQEQKEKHFKGVPLAILNELGKASSPLVIYYVLNENNEMIAFDMFYRHSDAATYYIGWNSEEGRKNYLNNLLLYHAAISLKRLGIKKLDLGGIEYIHTESVAKFKDGMKPKHFRQIGEFIKV